MVFLRVDGSLEGNPFLQKPRGRSVDRSLRLLLPEFWERPSAVAAAAAASRAMNGLLCAGEGLLHISDWLASWLWCLVLVDPQKACEALELLNL